MNKQKRKESTQTLNMAGGGGERPPEMYIDTSYKKEIHDMIYTTVGFKKFCYSVKKFGFIQGNLKGESVVAAILPSHMEGIYCTSRFFRSYKPAKQA